MGELSNSMVVWVWEDKKKNAGDKESKLDWISAGEEEDELKDEEQ